MIADGVTTDVLMTDVLIVGAGHAGVQLAVTLAQAERALSVTLVGEEASLPYERPPLTKRLLYDEGEISAVPLRSAEYWQRSPVRLMTGDPVVSIDPTAKRALTDHGSTIGYGSLVWAAGGRASSCGLPGEQLRGVHSIRGFGDLDALRTDLVGARSAVVVGGGYLGLEVAAALRQRGIAVTVVEVSPRLLARVTGLRVSEFFTSLHRRHGTDIRVGVGVEQIVGVDGRATGVRLGDGTEVAADVVVIGVGMRPNVDTLLAAGAHGDRAGIQVDGQCRTSLRDVYAIGDCATQLNSWSAAGTSMRVESVHNASQHAAVVARVLAGLPAVEAMPPRFWSTQYGCELKTVGLPASTDQEVVRGDPTRSQFSICYLRDGRLSAIDTINRPRDFARAQALIAAHWRPTGTEELADPDQELPRLVPVAAR